MKPVYLSLAQWQVVNRCVLQASESLLVQSYEAGDNKEARGFGTLGMLRFFRF